VPGTLLLKDYESANADELQQHLASLMAQAPTPSDTLTSPVIQLAPPPQPVVPEPSPVALPVNPRDELAQHLEQITGGSLKLMGEGLTSLGAGAQNVKQELTNHLVSLLPSAPAVPDQDLATHLGGAPLLGPSATGDVRPLQSEGEAGRITADINVPVNRGPSITREQTLAAVRGTPLEGIGNQIYDLGLKYNVDPAFALSIARNESNYGATPMQAQNNNVWDISNAAYGGTAVPGSRWGQYPDKATAAEAFYRLIVGEYYPRGQTTVGSVMWGPGGSQQHAYAPLSENSAEYPTRLLNTMRGYGSASAGEPVRATRPPSDLGYQDVSQFGDRQLTADEAYAACGPAAAVRFAQRFGRNPTLREATDLAATVGWTSGQGMAGLGSEKALMDKMGVPTKLVSGPDWGTFANEARTGNPVTISTQGHYFTADGWDPQTNRFHVGRSGLDLKGGAEWMTPEQMTSLMGPVQGGLLADNPASTIGSTQPGFTAPGGSTDQQAASVDQPRPLQLVGEGFAALGSGAQAVASGVQQAAQGGLKIIDNAIDTVKSGAGNAVADTSGPQTAAMQPTPSDVLTNPLGTGNAAQPSAALTTQPAGGIAEPTGPAVLPALDQAQQALRSGDLQGAQDALGQARDAVATSAVGPALGLARGPLLLSDAEVLQSREARTARDMLEQMNAADVAKGRTPQPITDQDVADAARTLMTSQAVAMTGEGFGRPTRAEPAAPVAPTNTHPSDRYNAFLSEQVRAPMSDPRPQAQDSGLPGIKYVNQANLTDVVPEGATLYHETSVPSAGALIERVEAGPRNHTPIFTSDNRDLALGQGGKGVMLEFEPARANGGVAPQKPGLEFTSRTGGGQEYTVSRTVPGAVKAIVVKTQRQADQLAKSPRIARRFDFAAAEQTPEGIRIPYRGRPVGADISAAVEPVAAPEPAGVGAEAAGFRAPENRAAPATGDTGGALPSRPPAAPSPGAAEVLPSSEGRTAAGDAAEVARLRLDKFPDWLQPTIEDAARATDFAAEQRRGVIPNAQAEAMADQVGRSVDDWIKQSKIGTTLNTEETRALRNVITGQAQKVQDLAEQVSTAAGRGEATDQLIAQAAIEGNKLQDLTTMMEGARAEWGRAGSAWKAETRLIDLPPNEAISEIYKTLGGRDNALAAVQELNALQQAGASPIQLAQFWAKLKNPEAGFQDWVKALRYNSMLSGPRTIEVNGIGNALEIPWRMARDTGASLLRGRPEELAPEAAGLVAGFDKGRRAFMETLTHGMTTEQALAGEIPHSLADRVRNPVLQPVAKVLDVPSRILGAGDAWGKAMAQSMALGRRAGVTASKEGLSGPAWNERVAELLSNPSKDMLKEADAISERMVYHGEMGSLGTALEQIQRVPFLGNVILPFLRTVYHIQARGIDRSPVGAIGTAIDIGRGKYGPRTLGNLREQLGASVGPSKGVAPLGERLGDNIMGTAATVAFFQKAQEGAITGAGPDDPEKRDMLRAQGWQPYSLKLGDHYVSYANWGPVATPLAMAAGAAEAIQYRKQNAANVPAILVDAGRRTAKLVTEQSYLQGIGAIWKALEQPDRYSAQTLGQMMTSLVPYGSALNTLGQARDPLQRQVGKVADVGLPAYLQQSVEARLPGLRERLPAAQDQLGRPIPNEAEGAGALNPLRSTTIRSNAVLQELLANGADVGEPPTSVRNVDLTPAEQRTVNEKAGQYIERNVQAVMADADYKKADDLGKQRALQRAIERARMQAGGELLQSLSEAEIKRRLEESRAKREPVPIGLGG
jgi:hypothetical protein